MRVVGDSPFGVDRASVIAAVKSLNVDEAIPHRRPDGSSVPPVLRSIISQCLRIDPMDRPTAEQVLTLLHAAIDSAFVAPVSTSASSTPPIAGPPPACESCAESLQR